MARRRAFWDAERIVCARGLDQVIIPNSTTFRVARMRFVYGRETPASVWSTVTRKRAASMNGVTSVELASKTVATVIGR